MVKRNGSNNNLLIGIVVVIVICILFGGFGFGYRGYGMMGGYDYGFMLFNNVIMILLTILIVVGIFWLIKNINHRGRR